MKCPKCGYLGFETSDRCRNCGYDFSLSVQVDAPAELPLHDTGGAGAPLADFDLGDTDSARERSNAFDLDRVIGAEPPALPLFQRPPAGSDEAPLVAPPRPARPPLSVRRATPDVVRVKSRTPRPRADEPALQLEPSAVTPPADAAEPGWSGMPIRAAAGARLVATLIDFVMLGAINLAVMYLTLAMAGLSIGDIGTVPMVPLAVFLVLIDGGYLIVFTAANGQTIGKMATSIRVIGDDGRRVDMAGALLRAAGCALSVLTIGLGYLPAFLTADGRALHDRIAGTRVVTLR